MAVKKVGYVEPADYFTPSMRKIAEDWDKKQAAKAKKDQATKKPAKKK